MENFLDVVSVLVISFVFCVVSVKLLKPLAVYINLVDKPGGRKKHVGAVPLVGGIAIFGSVALSSFVLIQQITFLRFFILAGGLIVFLGMLDDRYQLGARSRLVGQFLISCVFVYGLNIHIHTFGNLAGIGPLEAGWLGYVFTVLSLVGVTNAMNMLDGLDGLVGGVSLVSFLGLSILFALNGHSSLYVLCLIFIGAISAFLVFNLTGNRGVRKVFLGDAGSMFLGLALGVLLISGSQQVNVAFEPITALWFVMLPMTDMFTIMYRRIKRGRSPMTPDRTHVHHIFLRAGMTKRSALLWLLLIQSLLIFIGWYSVEVVSETFSFMLALMFVAGYQYAMKRSWKLIRWFRRRGGMIPLNG